MPGNNTRIFEKQTPGLSGHMQPEDTTDLEVIEKQCAYNEYFPQLYNSTYIQGLCVSWKLIAYQL